MLLVHQSHVYNGKSSPDRLAPPHPRPPKVIVTLGAQRKLSAVFALTADTDVASC